MKKRCVLLAAMFFLALSAPCSAAKSCPAMKKELSALRLEYHHYANSNPDGKGEAIKFDRLTEILDKIVELKREMTAGKCKIGPRDRDIKDK